MGNALPEPREIELANSTIDYSGHLSIFIE